MKLKGDRCFADSDYNKGDRNFSIKKLIKISNYKVSIFMKRARHPKSEIEDVLRYAEEKEWRVEVGGSHAWGKIYCPFNEKNCRDGVFCIMSIWSTPKNPRNHANQIRQKINTCIKYQ